jgi:ACT domain-containing protein
MGRWTFVIEAADSPDSLLRILNPCVVAGAALATVAMDRAARGVRVRIEAEALDEARAQTLRHRLQAIPEVASVAMGWRGAVIAAA